MARGPAADRTLILAGHKAAIPRRMHGVGAPSRAAVKPWHAPLSPGSINSGKRSSVEEPDRDSLWMLCTIPT